MPQKIKLGLRGRRREISRETERDLVAVVRFASDQGASIVGREFLALANSLANAERVAQGKEPRTKLLASGWSRKFRQRAKSQGVPDSLIEADTSGASGAGAGGSSAGDAGSGSGGTWHLRNMIAELARENKVRQAAVQAVTDEGVDKLRKEDIVRRQELKAQIAALQAQLDGLTGTLVFEEANVRYKYGPQKYSLETERLMLDRAFRILGENPSEAMYCRVASQISTLAGSERDDFGAMTTPVEGPLVGIRPTLQTTIPAARELLEKTIEETIVTARAKRARDAENDVDGQQAARRMIMSRKYAI
jgi:hypothetical protein